MTQGILFRHGGAVVPGARGRDGGGQPGLAPYMAPPDRLLGDPGRDRARDGLGASSSPRPWPPATTGGTYLNFEGVAQEVASSRRALVSSSLSTISRGPSVVVTSWARMPAAASRCRSTLALDERAGRRDGHHQPVLVGGCQAAAGARPATAARRRTPSGAAARARRRRASEVIRALEAGTAPVSPIAPRLGSRRP